MIKFNSIVFTVTSVIKTAVLFAIACCSAPALLLSFICVHYTNKLWIYISSRFYPDLEISKSKKIRTLIDTPRNAGIFHFLLELNGPCNFLKIRENYINHLTEKRTKTGELCFPKLRQRLVPCWGHYAWVRDSSLFDVNNHVVLSAKKYRGRPLSEGNLQEFISELVTKYIPFDIPQWQVIVVPVAKSDTFYVLVKIHHLLIAEEENLHISEILMLNSSDKLSQKMSFKCYNPKLSQIYEKPTHIPNILDKLSMVVTNRWNEFIYKYDCMESPDGDKRPRIQFLSQLVSVIFISFVTIITDFIKGYSKVRTELTYKIKFVSSLVRRELRKRDLSWEVAFDAVFTSLNPAHMLKNCIKIICIFLVKVIFYTPVLVFREFAVLKKLILTRRTPQSATIIGTAAIYLPLLINAIIEAFKICQVIVTAPRYIFEELFQHTCKEQNIIQLKSYSGRKVVSFSKSINLKHETQESLDLDSEISLVCIAGALKKYFEEFPEHPVPRNISTTYRPIAKQYFFDPINKTDHIGGVVFLKLPLCEPNAHQLETLTRNIESIRRRQVIIYLASVGQAKYDLLTSVLPRIVMKIFINYFSVHFPVTITEIYGDSSSMETIWGQTVQDVLLFRPPQSKTCLSLNIHHFGGKARLAIMADTQLAPQHSKITHFWETLLENANL